MKIQHHEPYGPLRAKAYPSVPDQLDAILKMAVCLKEQGIKLPQETLDWINSCQAVKDKYKKK